MLIIEIVHVNGKNSSLIVLVDEVVIILIKPLQILYLYCLLIIPSPLLDICDKMVGGRSQIYHQVRIFCHGCHHLKKLHVCVIVKVGYGTLLMIVLGEDINALED